PGQSTAMGVTRELLYVADGGQVSESFAAPLVTIAGGTHSISGEVGSAMFTLKGRGTNLTTDPETGRTVGADVSLQGADTLLEVTGDVDGGATITTQAGFV